MKKMRKTDTQLESQFMLDRVSEALEALEAPPPPPPPDRHSPAHATEELLLCMWSFRRDPQKWYADVEPLMRRLTAMKQPRFYDEDDRELFVGIVEDAKAFLEHREMHNLPR